MLHSLFYFLIACACLEAATSELDRGDLRAAVREIGIAAFHVGLAAIALYEAPHTSWVPMA